MCRMQSLSMLKQVLHNVTTRALTGLVNFLLVIQSIGLVYSKLLRNYLDVLIF
jgi:hypothetical protein